MANTRETADDFYRRLPRLETARLVIRPFTPADVEDYFAFADRWIAEGRQQARHRRVMGASLLPDILATCRHCRRGHRLTDDPRAPRTRHRS